MKYLLSKIKNMCFVLVNAFMKRKGFSNHYGVKIFSRQINDLFGHNKIPFRQKIWAHKKGFFSEKIALYDLNEDNYFDYVPDFNFYKLHPINQPYDQWINNKLTMKHILFPFSKYFPEYYYHFYNKEIIKLNDCPNEFGNCMEDVINLIKDKGSLAIKKAHGELGKGFIKVKYLNNKIDINNNIFFEYQIEDEINKLLNMKDSDLLITEYLEPHYTLKRIWSQSSNTVGVITIREQYQNPKIAYAYINIGTRISDLVDVPSSGGIRCNIDINTGEFNAGFIKINNIFEEIIIHPDTGVKLNGRIPYWNNIIKQIINISSYIPEIMYSGYELVVIDNGFKIIDINSHPNIELAQTHSPGFKNDVCQNFYKHLIGM